MSTGCPICSRVAWLLIVFFVAIGASLTAAAAAPFSGTVVDSSNQPLAGVAVVAGHVQSGPDSDQFIADGQATTDSQGHYSMTSVGAGDGSGNFVLAAQLSGYIAVVYPNRQCYYPACMTSFPPVVTPPLAAANFQLMHSASISGHVTRSDTNAAVCCVSVYYEAPNGGPSWLVNADADGNYLFSDVLPGNYKLRVFGDSAGSSVLLSQGYAGHDVDVTFGAAFDTNWDVVGVTEGLARSGIDFDLHPGLSFSGMITSAIDGLPLSAEVHVRRRTPVDNVSYYLAATSARYGEQSPGNYTSIALAPGTFIVSFGENDLFAPQYFSEVADEAHAQDVTLSNGQSTTGIDAQLTTKQSIAGRVTDANTGLPLQGVMVHAGEVFIFALQDYVDTVTDASGNYLLQGLGSTGGSVPPTSNYYLWVDGTPGYVSEFYPSAINTCCTFPPQGATTLALADSQHLTDIDFSLPKGAYASGRIYDPLTNASFANFGTQLYDASGRPIGPLYAHAIPTSALSDISGNYVSAAVPTGSYYLVAGNAFEGRVITIAYPNVICPSSGCDFSQAQLLNFSTAQEYPNLDFAIPHLDLIFRDGFDQ